MKTLSLIFKRSRDIAGLAIAVLSFHLFEVLRLHAEPAGFAEIRAVPANFYLVLAVFYIIPRLIHLDPPLSSDTFLLARPVEQMRLFGMKMLIVFVVCILPSLVELVLTARLIGLSSGLTGWAVLFLFIQLAAVALGCVLIASCTKKYTEYAMIAISALAVVGAVWYAVKTFCDWPERVFYLAPNFSQAQSIDFQMSSFKLLILVIVCVGAGLCSYLVHLRVSARRIMTVAAFAFVLGCGIEAALTYHVYNAARTDFYFTEEVVPVREAKVYRKHAVLGGDSPELARPYVEFVLASETVDPARIKHLLRFRRLSLTDQKGETTVIPALDRGLLPCLDNESVENFVSSRVGREIKLLNRQECPLGTNYRIPWRLIEQGRIAKVEGEVVGVDLTLVADYDVPLKEMAKPPTEDAPVGVYGRMNWKKLMNTNPWSRTGIKPLFYEVELLSPLVRSPVGQVNTASPLYTHWYASPRMYLVYNLKTGDAIRLETLGGAAGLQESSFLIRSTRPELFVTAGVGPIDLDDFVEHGRLMRIFPRINHGFHANVTLTDVPVLSNSDS